MLWCAQSAPLVIRRTHPTWAFGIAATAMLAQVVVNELLLTANVLLLAYVYSTAKYARHHVARLGVVGVCGVAVALFTWHIQEFLGPDTTWQNVASWASACLGFCWVLGFQAHRKNRSLHTLAVTNAIQRREMGQKVVLAQHQERLRIAGDLHQVVTQSLTDLDAQTSRTVVSWTPQASQAEFERIATTARQALDDARQLVSALRYAADDPAPRHSPGQSAGPDSGRPS